MTGPRRRLRNVLGTAVLLGVTAVVASPQPAGAHGLGGLEPTNYESRVVRVQPAVPGLTVRVVDLGGHLEVENHTGTAIDVAEASIVFTIPDGETAQWHEHAVHWHSGPPPDIVRRDPGHEHLIRRWTIGLRQGNRTIEVHGVLRWIPGPSPWPWVLVTVVAGAAALLAGWTRRRMPIAVALALLVCAQVIHLVGAWGASTASPGEHLVQSVYSLAGIALAVAALVAVVRRDVRTAAPLMLLAGLALALAGGLADVTVLTRSQLPFTLSAWLDRLVVAVTLGVGTAMAALGARCLRLPAAPVSRSPADAGDDALDALRPRYRSSDVG